MVTLRLRGWRNSTPTTGRYLRDEGARLLEDGGEERCGGGEYVRCAGAAAGAVEGPRTGVAENVDVALPVGVWALLPNLRGVVSVPAATPGEAYLDAAYEPLLVAGAAPVAGTGPRVTLGA